MINASVINITIAPTLSDANTLVIYRNNGDEIVVKIDKHRNLIKSNNKLEINEIYFIKINYL